MAAFGVEPVGSKAPAPVVQNVDRTSKGDRLPSGGTTSRMREAGLESEQPVIVRLPDGCEALVSAILDDVLAKVPRRCVS